MTCMFSTVYLSRRTQGVVGGSRARSFSGGKVHDVQRFLQRWSRPQGHGGDASSPRIQRRVGGKRMRSAVTCSPGQGACAPISWSQKIEFKFLPSRKPLTQGERLFAVHGLSERTTVQTSSLLLRLFFFYLLANPTHIANANPDPHPS